MIYLTNGDESWTHSSVGKSISNHNLKELEKIAKVTHNTDRDGTRVGTNQTRLAKSYVKINARTARNEDVKSVDKAKDESEVNNFVSDDEEKINRNNTQTPKDNKESTTYNFYPSRRDATVKRKQAVSTLTDSYNLHQNKAAKH